jgi:hypothetical protein
MHFSFVTLRRVGVGAIVMGVTLAFAAFPSQAQTMRQQMASKIAVDAGNTLVSKINGEDCSQFAATMAQMKNSKSSGSSSMSSKLKGNTQARTQFVNIVAAPLLNKMIDCNMMPGGM